MLTVMPDMDKDYFNTYWQGLQSHQFDWAFQAYARLVATLSTEVQEKLQLRETTSESYVVIFGKTQVGKTTLLLDLMGIDSQHISLISGVLRGGRAAGQSATATAMEYCRSESNQWGVTLQSQTSWFDSDDLVEKRLGELRTSMESGQLSLSAPCVVHIPNRFFAHREAVAPDMRILDLPGDNPSHQEEQKHVNQMAKTYLPFADLILLVGRGDDLSFLQPDVITLPGIEDWQAMPHRFRVVTTFSYSAQSVKDLMRMDAQYDVGKLRQRLKEQIALFGSLSEAASYDNLYFPLEFGTSWMSMKSREPDLYARILPMVTELREELLSLIATSVTPLGRLRGTLNAHLSVSYIQKKKLEKIGRTIEGLNKQLVQLLQETAVWVSALARVRVKSEKVSSLLALNLSDGGAEASEKAARNRYFTSVKDYPPSEGPKKNDSETLKSMIREYYQILMSMRVNVEDKNPFWLKVRSLLIEPCKQDVKTVLDDAFGAIRYKLNDFTFDTYLFSGRYAEDKKTLTTAGDRADANITTLWKSAWLTALNQADDFYRREYISLQTELDMLDSELHEAEKKEAFLRERIRQCHHEREQVIETSKDDMNRCSQFVDLLNEEYLAALDKQLNDVFQEKDSCNALMQLFSAVELKNNRDELMNLSKFY